MCLSLVYKGKQKKDALANLPDSGLYWKTVTVRKGKYYPCCWKLPGRRPFKVGWNVAQPKNYGFGYRVGFHFHFTRKAAREWCGLPIRIKVEKKDILAIGSQDGHLCIVAKRICMPKPLVKRHERIK